MKKFILTALVVCILFSFTGISAFANPMPIKELNLYVQNISTSEYYLDLLVDVSPYSSLGYDSFNTSYPESYKELPLYKYYKKGWLAYFIRRDIMYDSLEYSEYDGSAYIHNFWDPYDIIPKSFKVIIQYKTGELFVSKDIYAFEQYHQNTFIDFKKDFIKADGVVYGDLNGDNSVDSLDYTFLKRYVLKTVQLFPSPDGLKAGDLNGDGSIDSTDCTLLKRHILKIITYFPVEEIT